MDYLQGIVTLFISDSSEDALMKYLETPEAARTGDKPYIRPHQSFSEESSQLLKTMQDFASISKQTKLSNMFLEAYASLVHMHEETLTMQQQGQHAADVFLVRYNQILRRFDVLISLIEKVKLKKENQMSLLQGIKALIQDGRTKKKAYKLMAGVVKRFEFEDM